MSAFTNFSARVGFVRAVCVIAEAGFGMPKPARGAAGPRALALAVLHAVLHDAQRRVAALGGRVGRPRSVGSLMAAHIVLFLGSTFRGRETAAIATPGVRSDTNGIAVSRDGNTVLITGTNGDHALYVFCARTGELLRTIGGRGRGPLQFRYPHQVSIAPDDFVFVADTRNHRIQVLTPSLGFHGILGEGQLYNSFGVCADEHVVVVSERRIADGHASINIFDRVSGHLLRRIGQHVLKAPFALCFMANHRAVAVVDDSQGCVIVLSLDGCSVRRVGAGLLYHPSGIACSAYDELVVTNQTQGHNIIVFDSSGERRKTIVCEDAYYGIHVHDRVLFAQCYSDTKCIVLS
jgi:hypothetical protein